MKKCIFLYLTGWMLCSTLLFASQPIRVACIGNSITYGSRISDRDKDSYPAVLGNLLGNGYEVENFGLSGRTLSKETERPYLLEERYQQALAYQPDIVIIKLGTNDSQPRHWRGEESIKAALNEMIGDFQTTNENVTIYLCLPVPAFGVNDYTIEPEKVSGPIQQWIREVAQEHDLSIIDLYTALEGSKEFFPDLVHPDEAGARMIAEEVYKRITE